MNVIKLTKVCFNGFFSYFTKGIYDLFGFDCLNPEKSRKKDIMIGWQISWKMESSSLLFFFFFYVAYYENVYLENIFWPNGFSYMVL